MLSVVSFFHKLSGVSRVLVVHISKYMDNLFARIGVTHQSLSRGQK
jgi:hypothetical protein